MYILHWIIGLQSQIIDFTNVLAQAYIPSGNPVFIELTRYFKSKGKQCDVVLMLNKSLYVQSKAYVSGMKSCKMVC